MKITHGLLPGQVLQRDSKNNGKAVVSGMTSTKGLVEFRILKETKPIRGAGWKTAGKANGTTFLAKLSSIPVGGPYAIQLRVTNGQPTTEVITIADVFVGDVWFMGGQSNMQGCGNIVNAPAPHPMVRAFFMRDEWDIASEPMHFIPEAVDTFHNQYGSGPARPSEKQLDKARKESLKGVSPGLYFGIEMNRRTGVPQGLVACAHGGTSMAQWSPALRRQGGASLYGAMMRRFEKLGQPIRGMIWYQGESDANVNDAAVYTDRMIELVAATRKDMKLPGLAWLTVQIGCHIARDNGEWNNIQEQQRLLPGKIKNLEVAPAIDLGIDDGIHISGDDQKILGERLARLADHVVFRNPEAKGSIVLKKITVAFAPPFPGEPNARLLTLTYGNVAGKLQSAGRPHGFVILNAEGTPLDAIYKTRISGNTVLLQTDLQQATLETASVSYGHNRYSYCNVTDEEGMSLPAMCRVPIPGDAHTLPFLLNWEAALLREEGPIAGITKEDTDSVQIWDKTATEQGFAVLPRPLSQNRDGVFVFRTNIKATAGCDAKLFFGADSPFMLWINGKEILKDAQATNPCLPDQYKKMITLKKGNNAVTVVFDSRKSAGWGICMRLAGIRKSDNLKTILTF